MSMKIHFIQRLNAYYVSGLSTYNMSLGLNCMRGLIKTWSETLQYCSHLSVVEECRHQASVNVVLDLDNHSKRAQRNSFFAHVKL